MVHLNSIHINNILEIYTPQISYILITFLKFTKFFVGGASKKYLPKWEVILGAPTRKKNKKWGV